MTPEEIFEWILDLIGGIFPTISITAIILIVVLGLLIPFIISVWIAYDASKDPKNLSSGKTSNAGMGILWFFLSFFVLPLLMWIIYLFYRTPSGQRNKRKAKTKKD